MPALLTRRGFAVGAAALLAPRGGPAHAETDDGVAFIERRYGGRLGVFALDTGSGRMLSHRADERFLMCSTFKGVLAAHMLSRVDAGQDSLASLVPYSAENLVGYSPVTRANVAKGALDVETLCSAIVLFSDNGAANLLLARVGGPAALTAYVRGLGDPTTRFDRYEIAASDRSGILDTTTPRAIAGTAQTILLRPALSQTSRARLEQWMVACRTGDHRLRAAFPKSWRAGDKTGTGDGACNDYAIVRRPGRAPLVMAAYYDRQGMETAAQEAVLREVGSSIVAWAG